jgi:hypothetical protein
MRYAGDKCLAAGFYNPRDDLVQVHERQGPMQIPDGYAPCELSQLAERAAAGNGILKMKIQSPQITQRLATFDALQKNALRGATQKDKCFDGYRKAVTRSVRIEDQMDSIVPYRQDSGSGRSLTMKDVGSEPNRRRARQQERSRRQPAASRILRQQAVSPRVEGECQSRFAVASGSGQKDRGASHLDCSCVKPKVSAFHKTEHRRNTPQALLAANLIFVVRYLDGSRAWIDPEPPRVVRPEMKNPIQAIEPRRNVAGGVSEDPLGNQRALRRRYGLRRLSNIEGFLPTSFAQKS